MYVMRTLLGSKLVSKHEHVVCENLRDNELAFVIRSWSIIQESVIRMNLGAKPFFPKQRHGSEGRLKSFS